MKYALLALIISLFIAVCVARGAYRQLDDTRAKLTAAEVQLNAQREVIAQLERSQRITDEVMEQWEHMRNDAAVKRENVRQNIKQALRNETNSTWGAAPVPADMWRLLW